MRNSEQRLPARSFAAVLSAVMIVCFAFVSFASGDPPDFVLAAYQQDESLISSSSTGSLSFTATKGKVYYIKFYATGQTSYAQNQSYILYWS